MSKIRIEEPWSNLHLSTMFGSHDEMQKLWYKLLRWTKSASAWRFKRSRGDLYLRRVAIRHRWVSFRVSPRLLEVDCAWNFSLRFITSANRMDGLPRWEMSFLWRHEDCVSVVSLRKGGQISSWLHVKDQNWGTEASGLNLYNWQNLPNKLLFPNYKVLIPFFH